MANQETTIHKNTITELHFRNKITFISFFCSLLVIWIHTYNLEIYSITEDSEGLAKIVYIIENYWNELTHVAVSTFFLISGFLFYRRYLPKRTITKYKSRIKSIFIPYLCWCSLYYLYYVLVTNIPLIRNIMNTDNPIAFSLITWFRWLWIDKYYTLWFLQDLIIYILLAPLLYVILKNRNKFPCGTVFILFILLNAYHSWISISSGFILYCVGSYLAINHKNSSMYKNKSISTISFLYIIFSFLSGFAYFHTICQILFIISFWFALDFFESTKKLPWWMQITFFTYVAHDVFLESFEKIFLIAFGSHPVCALLDYIFMPIIVLITLIGIAQFMRRYTPRIWKLLTGSRV